MNISDKQIIPASDGHKKTKMIMILTGVGVIVLLVALIVGIFSVINKKQRNAIAEQEAAIAKRIDAAFESIKDAEPVSDKRILSAFIAIEGADTEPVTEDRINAAFEAIQ